MEAIFSMKTFFLTEVVFPMQEIFQWIDLFIFIENIFQCK
jgi:hypothetical protein